MECVTEFTVFEITAAGTYSTNLSETENGASGNPITISAVTANSGSVLHVYRILQFGLRE
jgi:hypothetical protein